MPRQNISTEDLYYLLDIVETVWEPPPEDTEQLILQERLAAWVERQIESRERRRKKRKRARGPLTQADLERIDREQAAFRQMLIDEGVFPNVEF